MAAGFAFVLAGYALNGIWFAFIGWFLANAARGEAETMQLETVLGPLKARDVMTADFRSVTPGTPIQSIVDDHLVGEGHRAVMIANDGVVLGILTVSDIRHINRGEWPNTPDFRICTQESCQTVSTRTDIDTDLFPYGLNNDYICLYGILLSG